MVSRALRTTAMGTFAALFLLPSLATAFDPNEGAEATAPAKGGAARLPSTAPLIEPLPKLVFPPLAPARQTPVENQVSSVSAPPGAYVQPIPAPVAPLPDAQPAPQFPPVDPAIAARAERELLASQPVTAPASQGFIAPAPLLAITTPLPAENLTSHVVTRQQTPIENPALPVATGKQIPVENPVATSPEPLAPVALSAGAPAVASAEPLSDASRSILSKFPSKLNGAPAAASKSKQDVAINRLSPDIKAIVAPNVKIESYDSVGLSIKVQRPGLDTNFELNRAYTALNNGDTTVAAETYRNILQTEPNNEDALFGLAATYHRLGDLDRARPYYAQLLKINPNHREGLINFLALVSDEAPQEALAELERLEQRNPEFSPIPAQQAALLMKSGYPDQAREKMLRAIELAPDNLTYKYNLAIMLDRQGNYTDASALYRLLIDASLKGQKIPAPLDTIQKRLNYIAAAAVTRSTAGS